MIGFNPCRPCCKVLTIRAKIEACFLTDRNGNPDPAYDSIRAEFFDGDDNSLLVIEDDYDEKTFEMPGGYKGTIRSVTTGTSSHGDPFEVHQTFTNFNNILAVEVLETQNFICCNRTWTPKILSAQVSIGSFDSDNANNCWLDGEHVTEKPRIGDPWNTVDIIKCISSITSTIDQPFVISYDPATQIWSGCLKAMVYDIIRHNYIKTSLTGDELIELSGSPTHTSGFIFLNFSIQLCLSEYGPSQLFGWTWDMSTDDYVCNTTDGSGRISDFGVIYLSGFTRSFGNETFSFSADIGTGVTALYFGHKNARITLS